MERRLGGNGASTSYCLGRLGTRVRLAGRIGRDPEGEFLLTELAAVQADTAWVERCDEPTAATVVLVNSAGERAILHRPGASLDAFAEPITFHRDLTEGCSHFHLANIYAFRAMRPHAATMLRRARRAGLTTSVDTGWDSLGEWSALLDPCLPHVDLLFVNAAEARMLTGIDNPDAAARMFLDRGARAVVIKLGEQGCAVHAEGIAFHRSGFGVAVVDTTGAGDCFVGGFLSALHHGQPLEEAARFANAVGALSTQRLGATAGLLSYDETLAWIAGR